MKRFNAKSAPWLLALCVAGVAPGAMAQQTVKIGMSLPLSGAGAAWGKTTEWMCRQAAKEISEAGGIKVKGVSHPVECLVYDNKYTAAEGAKIAQTLLNRDKVRYLAVLGGAPGAATQALSERQGALMFNLSWAKSSKGPKFPLSFSVVNSAIEIAPAMVEYIVKTHPQAKTVALFNVNDATGRETHDAARPVWEKAGIKVLASDFYERGTTEFQPAAARLMALKPDIVDIASAPPAEAGQMLKELTALGFKGIKITDNGTSADGLVTIGGAAVEGVYLGAALPFEGPGMTDRQRQLNAQAKAYSGVSLDSLTMAGYDAVYMLKAAAEKAQSLEPKDLAAVMPTVRYRSFVADDVALGGKDVYGSVQQPILPVYITQIVNGKLVERARIAPGR